MRRGALLLVALLAAVSLGGPAAGQALPPPPAPPPPEVAVDEAEPAQPERLEAPVATDTLRSRPVPEGLAAYRADPDFQYDRPQAQGPSLWDRFWTWVWRTLIEPIFQNTSGQMVQWIVVGLAVVLLGWVVTRLLRVEGGGVFGRSSGSTATAGPLLDVEDIGAVDVRALLDRAVAQEAWREAVRFRYLVLLQEMAAAGAVDWRRDKTNRTYAEEARAYGPALARPFGRATRVFDYVWYGERPVDRARYAALVPVFDEVSAALATRQPAAA